MLVPAHLQEKFSVTWVDVVGVIGVEHSRLLASDCGVPTAAGLGTEDVANGEGTSQRLLKSFDIVERTDWLLELPF